MTIPEKALEQARDVADDDQQTVENPQAYVDELVAVMTEILDQKHPLPTTTNNTTYTENLTTSPDVMPQVFDRTDLTPRERLSAAFDLPAATPLCPYIAAAVELHDPQHPASQYAHDYKVAIAARLTATAHEAGATNPEQLGEQLALLLDGASARTRALNREFFSTVATIAAVLITTPSPRRFHRSRAMTAEPSDLLLSRRVANDNSRHLVGRNNDGPGRSCMRPDDGVGL